MKLVIPTRPDLLVELQALMATDPDACELAALIKKDVASYSILLSIVNSPLFRRQEPIHSVEQAVAMLGTQRVATMLQTVALRTQMDPNNAWEKFWQMATEVATLSYQLARELNALCPDSAYSLGMMHDIGTGVLRATFADYEERASETNTCNAVATLKSETACFGVDRYTAAGELAERWFMPDELCAAIRWQAHAQASLMGRAEVPDSVLGANALLVLAKDISQQYESYWNFESLSALSKLVERSVDYFGLDRNDYLDMKEDLIHKIAFDIG